MDKRNLLRVIMIASLLLGTILLMMTAFMADSFARLPNLCDRPSGERTQYEGKFIHCTEQRVCLTACFFAFVIGILQVFAAVIELVKSNKPWLLLLKCHVAFAVVAIIMAIMIFAGVTLNREWFEAAHPAVSAEMKDRPYLIAIWAVLFIFDGFACIGVCLLGFLILKPEDSAPAADAKT